MKPLTQEQRTLVQAVLDGKTLQREAVALQIDKGRAIELLRLARSRIERYSLNAVNFIDRFICSSITVSATALEASALGSKIYETEASWLKQLIRGRLDGYVCLESWLIASGHVTDNAYFLSIDQSKLERLQRTRLAWIDSLIEELSE